MASRDELRDLCGRVFGIDRPFDRQLDAVSAILDGEDLLVVSPTGSGKSLIYQLAALAHGGLTVVVTPLLALAEDQVRALSTALDADATTVRAARWSSEESAAQKQEIRSGIEEGSLRLLYVAPESLVGAELSELLREHPPWLMAVDEAHCVSSWGSGFRPAYAELGRIREELGHPRLVALTATASATVRDDIVAVLKMEGHREFVLGFERDNLSLSVARVHDEAHRREAVLERTTTLLEDGLGLIYCRTRRGASEIAQALVDRGVDAECYHAGLSKRERERIHARFSAAEVQVVVATSAFGMGIDQPSTRFVVHAQAPESLDVYYQESGRAGRDGTPATAELFFGSADFALGNFFAGGMPRTATVERVVAARRSDPSADPRTLAKTTGLSVRSVGRVTALLDHIDPADQTDADRAVRAIKARAEAQRALRRSHVERVRDYVESDHCRDLVLRRHFGDEVADDCGRCDRCLDPEGAQPYRPVDLGEGLHVGAEVRHRRFRLGRITDLTRETVTVLFDGSGYRTLSTALVRDKGLLKPAAA